MNDLLLHVLFNVSDVLDVNSKPVFIVFFGVGHCWLSNEDMGIETSELWATWSCWAITEASFNYLFFLCLFFKCMMMKSRYKQRKNVACALIVFVRIRLATNLIGYHLKRYDVAWRARKIHFKLPIWFLLMWVASTWYKEL